MTHRTLSFHYPDFKQVYTASPRYTLRHAKFALRRLLMSRQIMRFERYVNTAPHAQIFFHQHEHEAYPLLHLFTDSRFGATKRQQIMQYDLEAALKNFGATVFKQISQKPYHCLIAKLPNGCQLWLNRNDQLVDEGWWAVSLRNVQGERIYTASFTFLPHNALLIGSVQGPNTADAKDVVRQMTKTLHGIRPQHFMINALQLLSGSLKTTPLLGIAQDNQVKLRWALKKRVQINYDDLWANAGGTRNAQDGYWHLPALPARKNESEIKSQKRAMYRRRYAMLDEIAAQMQRVFSSSNHHSTKTESE